MVVDILLVLLAFTLLLSGFIGCIVPFIPGPPLGYLGLVALHFTRFGGFSPTFLLVWALVTVLVTVADFYLPAWLARRYGGSRAASIGSVLGLIAGMFFFPPLGLILGSFAGAFIGEIIHDSSSEKKALKVALSAFAAFMLGTGMKMIVCGVMIFYAVRSFFI